MSAISHELNFSALEQIGDLGLRARIMVQSYFTGVHSSPRYGHNAEFASYREYVAGDDIKHIDWRAWARTDNYFVKLFNADCNLSGIIALDTSDSMCFNGPETQKYRMGLTTAAALAMLMLRQHDTFGFVSFNDSVQTDIEPRSSDTHFCRILHTLDTLIPGGPTGFSALSILLEQRLKKRSIIMVISDFTADIAEIADGIARLAFYGHELVLLRPLSEDESLFPYRGRVVLVDSETGERQLVRANDVRPQYLENLAAHTKALNSLARRHGADCETFTTNDISVKPLAAYLIKREMLR